MSSITPRRYELLKGLPDCKIGAIAEWNEGANAYKMRKSGAWVSPHQYLYYTKGTVENSPDFFKEIKENKELDIDPFDKFEVAVEKAINKYSMENISNTPDYISAEFIRKMFELFNKAILLRDKWYNFQPNFQPKQQANTTKEELVATYYGRPKEKYVMGVDPFTNVPISNPVLERNQKEKIEVLGVRFDKERYNGKWGNVIKIYVPYEYEYEKEVNKSKIPLIKQAIEQVLNDEVDKIKFVNYSLDTKYTEEDLRKAFEAGRERIGLAWNAPIKNWQHVTFEDYKTSKQQP
jgi:hypothetical protein